jgi:ABC-2 type transport system ATP-binding protein
MYIVWVITTNNLSKKFKKQLAVDSLSFNVEAGKVTGFVGPNGAGKSTTMRLMLGLANGGGKTVYDGKPLREYLQPSKVVGILLEAKAFHPTRTARRHLKVLAAAGGIEDKRVDEVLDIVGLKNVAKKTPGKFSLGMSQRLGIAAAILGEPKYLILDEPANGLDPEGILWLRNFLKDYADAGNGVFVSSHLLSEMSQMADNVVVIGKGKLIASGSIKDIVNKADSSVFVRSNKLAALDRLLKSRKISVSKSDNGLIVRGLSTDQVGNLAYKAGVPLLELSGRSASLEEAFLEITADAQEYQAREVKPKRWSLRK